MDKPVQRARCKFYCSEVLLQARPVDADGEQPEPRAQIVKMYAVHDDGIDENRAFCEATPSGNLEVLIDNPAVRGFFKPGKQYFLDITEAPE